MCAFPPETPIIQLRCVVLAVLGRSGHFPVVGDNETLIRHGNMLPCLFSVISPGIVVKRLPSDQGLLIAHLQKLWSLILIVVHLVFPLPLTITQPHSLNTLDLIVTPGQQDATTLLKSLK